MTKTLGFPKHNRCGKLNYDSKTLCDTIENIHQDKKQIAIHCHGERAVHQVLDVYEKVSYVI